MAKKQKRPSEMEIDEWLAWCQKNTEKYLKSISEPKDPPRSAKRIKSVKPKKTGVVG